MSEKPTDPQFELLGTIAHDLKNPIASIKSYADLIASTGDLNEQQQRYLQRIYLVVDNVSALIDDLINVVWVEGGMEPQRAPCNFLDIIRSQINALEGYAHEKSITLHYSHSGTLAVVQVDERRMCQVVANLIGNGIKYNRPGGHVWVEISRTDDALHVTVRDDGMGIEAADLPYIFERFFRAQHGEAAHVEGTGLGLSIAKAIIERHGGSIHVESIPGKGSIFSFTVPL